MFRRQETVDLVGRFSGRHWELLWQESQVSVKKDMIQMKRIERWPEWVIWLRKSWRLLSAVLESVQCLFTRAATMVEGSPRCTGKFSCKPVCEDFPAAEEMCHNPGGPLLSCGVLSDELLLWPSSGLSLQWRFHWLQNFALSASLMGQGTLIGQGMTTQIDCTVHVCFMALIALWMLALLQFPSWLR